MAKERKRREEIQVVEEKDEQRRAKSSAGFRRGALEIREIVDVF